MVRLLASHRKKTATNTAAIPEVEDSASLHTCFSIDLRHLKAHQVFSPDHIAVELLLDLADYLLADVGLINLGEDVA